MKMTNEPFVELLDKIKAIHEKKSADYSGDGHYENFERSALLAQWFNDDRDKPFVVLIAVKLARLATLLNKDAKPQNEPIADTFLDLCTYCALWATYHSIPRPTRAEYVKDELRRFSTNELFWEMRARGVDVKLDAIPVEQFNKSENDE
jgi:hypothetical protein